MPHKIRQKSIVPPEPASQQLPVDKAETRKEFVGRTIKKIQDSPIHLCSRILDKLKKLLSNIANAFSNTSAKSDSDFISRYKVSVKILDGVKELEKAADGDITKEDALFLQEGVNQLKRLCNRIKSKLLASDTTKTNIKAIEKELGILSKNIQNKITASGRAQIIIESPTVVQVLQHPAQQSSIDVSPLVQTEASKTLSEEQLPTGQFIKTEEPVKTKPEVPKQIETPRPRHKQPDHMEALTKRLEEEERLKVKYANKLIEGQTKIGGENFLVYSKVHDLIDQLAKEQNLADRVVTMLKGELVQIAEKGDKDFDKDIKRFMDASLIGIYKADIVVSKAVKAVEEQIAMRDGVRAYARGSSINAGSAPLTPRPLSEELAKWVQEIKNRNGQIPPELEERFEIWKRSASRGDHQGDGKVNKPPRSEVGVDMFPRFVAEPSRLRGEFINKLQPILEKIGKDLFGDEVPDLNKIGQNADDDVLAEAFSQIVTDLQERVKVALSRHDAKEDSDRGLHSLRNRLLKAQKDLIPIKQDLDRIKKEALGLDLDDVEKPVAVVKPAVVKKPVEAEKAKGVADYDSLKGKDLRERIVSDLNAILSSGFNNVYAVQGLYTMFDRIRSLNDIPDNHQLFLQGSHALVKELIGAVDDQSIRDRVAVKSNLKLQEKITYLREMDQYLKGRLEVKERQAPVSGASKEDVVKDKPVVAGSEQVNRASEQLETERRKDVFKEIGRLQKVLNKYGLSSEESEMISKINVSPELYSEETTVGFNKRMNEVLDILWGAIERYRKGIIASPTGGKNVLERIAILRDKVKN